MFIATTTAATYLVAYWAGEIPFDRPILGLVCCFFGVFLGAMYFNPELWFRRMAASSFAALVATHGFSGAEVSVPVWWSTDGLILNLPSPGFWLSVTLGALTVFFTLMHIRQQQRLVGGGGPPP